MLVAKTRLIKYLQVFMTANSNFRGNNTKQYHLKKYNTNHPIIQIRQIHRVELRIMVDGTFKVGRYQMYFFFFITYR